MEGAVQSRVSLAALFLFMSFSYGNGSNPPIDYPRLLISDTTAPGIFSDEEIQSFAAITAGVWQSGPFYGGVAGVATLPASPVNYLRIAALACDALACNQAKYAAVQQLLDVKIDASKASTVFAARAKQYRDVDDDSMAFVIIEQVQNDWTFKERFWKQAQRLGLAV